MKQTHTKNQANGKTHAGYCITYRLMLCHFISLASGSEAAFFFFSLVEKVNKEDWKVAKRVCDLPMFDYLQVLPCSAFKQD